MIGSIKEVVAALLHYRAVVLERRVADKGLKVDEAATVLGVSGSTVKRWCEDGTLRFNRTALGHRFVSADSVITKLASMTAEAAEERRAS